MFSKACEYGIRASIFIAKNSQEGNRVSPKEISEEINSPKAFTAKILQALVKHNIVKSIRGAHGGFEINKDKIVTIKLSQIVLAIDGNSVYSGCGLGLKTCDENHPCPVHDKFESIRNELKYMLETTNLEELAQGIKSGTSFLKV
ncbi:Rrf2 family transcriptional regulator [Oceanihabitans sp. 2_MG-2023]|uniref:RrF2 family transcriptional regulator n=1 Tax=Oceanihabitans sp. 2_MG-2023 TaxID=3062661 RepID=UPI0026E160F5|nr:Rrf2 family transcriptional regulator [Oceanihabitans sp. 2_MG-2023]MDO6597078.1 Rrf2 family transcriptional regulator [Oceanihabitans sp. 2_MG-2023]